MGTKKRIFIFIFVLILLILAGVFLRWERNSYSKEVLKLEILGPTKVDFAQEVEYTVQFKNNGNFRLENPKLVFIPPEHSVVDGNDFGIQTLGTEKLGEAIYPGEEKSFSFKMRLLGEEGDREVAKASLTYELKNLKAKYESSTSFTSIIKSVPINLRFDLPSKIESGKDFTFQINYFSNVDYPLADLRCQVDYPSGFEFIESTPQSIENVEWSIPLLNKSEGGRVEVKGRFGGDVGEIKIFKARLGFWREGQFILLKKIEKGVEIVKPSIYIRQEINKNPNYTASAGDWLHYEIYFKNIGDEALKDLFIVCKLEGDGFDFQTLKSDLGEVHPGDNSVVFDWRKIPRLQYLNPVEEGKVDFFVKLKDDLGDVREPVLINKVFIGQAKAEFTTKISSKLEIVQKGYFQDEIFGNSGPLPPEVGKVTTYTIMWQVKNYYSDVNDVKVKAKIPQGVELTGRVFPDDEFPKFTFDSQSREIVWMVGDLKKGTGVTGPGPNISFQIKFLPSESQRGKTPILIEKAVITGEDIETGVVLRSSSKSINTALPDDSTVSESMGQVH